MYDSARLPSDELLPVRPGVAGRPPERCLRGHRLTIAEASAGWSHDELSPTVTCRLCSEIRAQRATWLLIDPARQYITHAPREHRPALIAHPPLERTGVGSIQLKRRGVIVGDVDISICGPCRRAVLESIRVDDAHRRRGYGLVLLAAAVARAPIDQYDWSSTAVPDTVTARGFWSVAEFPGTLGTPNYCTDMHGRSDQRSTAI